MTSELNESDFTKLNNPSFPEDFDEEAVPETLLPESFYILREKIKGRSDEEIGEDLGLSVYPVNQRVIEMRDELEILQEHEESPGRMINYRLTDEIRDWLGEYRANVTETVYEAEIWDPRELLDAENHRYSEFETPSSAKVSSVPKNDFSVEEFVQNKEERVEESSVEQDKSVLEVEDQVSKYKDNEDGQNEDVNDERWEQDVSNGSRTLNEWRSKLERDPDVLRVKVEQKGTSRDPDYWGIYDGGSVVVNENYEGPAIVRLTGEVQSMTAMPIAEIKEELTQEQYQQLA